MVATDWNSTDPSLRPPKYQRRRADMFEAVVQLIEDQPSYKVVAKEKESARLKAERKGGLFGTVDDVEIWVEGDPSGPVSVHMKSTPRVALLSFGQGKRNIREFTRLLHYRAS